MEFITKSAEETKGLGKKIANSLISNKGQVTSNKNGAIVLALTGELGSGKTTFIQGLARGLGIKQRIISPTFILMRKYKIKVKDFYHIDLYRLEENVEREVKNLGIEEIWGSPANIVAIEWAEKIEKIIPKSAKWIKFENLGGDKRKITMK